MFKNSKAFSSFSVSDLEKAKEFYRNVVGLEVSPIKEGLEVSLGGGGKVFVYAKPDHSPASFTVLNFPVEDVERTVGALSERGVKFESYDLPGIKTDARGIADCDGARIAWFKDPSGNIAAVLEAE